MLCGRTLTEQQQWGDSMESTVISCLSMHFEPKLLVCTWLVGAYFTHRFLDSQIQ